MIDNRSSASTRVVVIGGGYAGTMAANRLTKRRDVDVALINPRAEFVERVRLHQLVGGTHDAVHDFAAVLSPRVRLVVDTAVRIDAQQRAVGLISGATVAYDYLVYAVGSFGATPSMPGVAEFAYPISTLEDARRARAAVDVAPESGAVTIVGAGPTGIETAAELTEQGRGVTLVCGGELGPYLEAPARRVVGDRLRSLKVTVLDGDGDGARVVEVGAATVLLEDGREVASDVTLWTAGFAVPDLAARSGLSTDEAGRLLTDETLTSVDSPRIVAAGDSASPSGAPYRMSCQIAVPLGNLAADTVLARIDGREPKAVAPGFVGQCLSLGRRFGVYQFASKDDHATKAYVAGRSAAILKESGSGFAYGSLVFEGKRPGLMNWVPFKDTGRQGLLESARVSA
ncbi:FAD-dependent oxidoreductase [Sinomonas notoginsengisoli]|uniref:NAD(P)/FAD-dependent oxidoreductase n=1 Tax=Sinomonas notoginsengisoli TaxID=1457311 RepID=UPI001F329A0E|nr:FAD-dependent oxidoreductase [Sinomonas notoginsengisoli]